MKFYQFRLVFFGVKIIQGSFVIVLDLTADKNKVTYLALIHQDK